MYRRVMLAYDGSLEGRTALREGALLARQVGARLYLLCVIAETPGMRIGEAAHSGAMFKTQESYVELFDEAMQRLKGMGFDVEGRVVSGEPAEQIAAYANEIDVDLIVVGHRRRSLLERWWSGASGAYLVDHIKCSLLIARKTVTDEDFRTRFADADSARSN